MKRNVPDDLDKAIENPLAPDWAKELARTVSSKMDESQEQSMSVVNVLTFLEQCALKRWRNSQTG